MTQHLNKNLDKSDINPMTLSYSNLKSYSNIDQQSKQQQ